MEQSHVLAGVVDRTKRVTELVKGGRGGRGTGVNNLSKNCYETLLGGAFRRECSPPWANAISTGRRDDEATETLGTPGETRPRSCAHGSSEKREARARTGAVRTPWDWKGSPPGSVTPSSLPPLLFSSLVLQSVHSFSLSLFI